MLNNTTASAKYEIGLGSSSYNLGSGTITTNQLVHVCLMRSGTSIYLFENGVQIGTTQTFSGSVTSVANQLRVGGASTGQYDLSGYVSNLRMVIGSAVYSTSGFTPPTSPLTAITNTSLLICQSNRYVDNSSNGIAITPSGNTSVVAFSPFKPIARWSAATYGGSGYFDGSGDYLRTTGSALAVDSGTFTYEAWVFPTSLAASISGIFDSRIYTGSAGTNGIGLFLTSGGEVRIDNSAGTILTTSGAAITVNSWVHIAAEKNGGNLIIYVNGVSKGSVANSATYSSTEISIGTSFSNAWPFTGYISSFRLVTSAVYGGNFTPPTSPPTAIANTSLLLNFTNAGIYDATSKNDLETVGSVQISTAQSKFGGSSIYFDGTGDYLNFPSSQLFGLETGDFTIEFWLYLNTVSGTQNLCDFRNATATEVAITLYMNLASPRLYVNGADRITGGNLITGQWYYIALTRSSTSTKLFVDGTQSGSTYPDSNNYLTPRPLRIGTTNDGTSQFPLNAYIQDFRITKGYARYTSNFTPPTQAFLTL
jgi:hypothetical protein